MLTPSIKNIFNKRKNVVSALFLLTKLPEDIIVELAEEVAAEIVVAQPSTRKGNNANILEHVTFAFTSTSSLKKLLLSRDSYRGSKLMHFSI